MGENAGSLGQLLKGTAQPAVASGFCVVGSASPRRSVSGERAGLKLCPRKARRPPLCRILEEGLGERDTRNLAEGEGSPEPKEQRKWEGDGQVRRGKGTGTDKLCA